MDQSGQVGRFQVDNLSPPRVLVTFAKSWTPLLTPLQMVTVIQLVHVYEQRYIRRGWRWSKQPKRTLWLYFGQVTDDGPDDNISYGQACLKKHAIRIHGQWLDGEGADQAAQNMVRLLRSQGQEVEVEWFVDD